MEATSEIWVRKELFSYFPNQELFSIRVQGVYEFDHNNATEHFWVPLASSIAPSLLQPKTRLVVVCAYLGIAVHKDAHIQEKKKRLYLVQ